jgi:hypothetical protein
MSTAIDVLNAALATGTVCVRANGAGQWKVSKKGKTPQIVIEALIRHKAELASLLGGPAMWPADMIIRQFDMPNAAKTDRRIQSASPQ